MNKSNVTELDKGFSDELDHSPVPGYEVIVLTWLEQLRSAASVDELKELEEYHESSTC
jgi:hypothetical protein